MKRIEAIIRNTKIEEVKEALRLIDINYFIYSECIEAGKQIKQGVYRGNKLLYNMTRFLVNVVVPDEDLRKTVDCILNAVNTGEVGDGEIFVSTIDESWKVRTKESITAFF